MMMADSRRGREVPREIQMAVRIVDVLVLACAQGLVELLGRELRAVGGEMGQGAVAGRNRQADLVDGAVSSDRDSSAHVGAAPGLRDPRARDVAGRIEADDEAVRVAGDGGAAGVDVAPPIHLDVSDPGPDLRAGSELAHEAAVS